MELKIGSVVQNQSGHDKGFFAVVKIDGPFVYMANGKSRLLNSPKKKNPKHLILTKAILDMDSITTDRKLRAALWPFNYGDAGEQIVEERDPLG